MILPAMAGSSAAAEPNTQTPPSPHAVVLLTVSPAPAVSAARLHAAEQALADPDPAVRDQAAREAAEIVQAAYREVAGG
jgi:hypothetical protein